MNPINRLSVTTTVPRQSQQVSFGEQMRNGLQTAGSLVGTTLVGSLPNLPIVSAAVSSVTGLAGARSTVSAAATGVVPGGQTVSVGSVGSAAGGAVAGASATSATLESSAGTGDVGGMVRAMKQEADRSMAVQLQMQQESREYNTLSNVLKVRHDSAKAAINNIR